MTDIILIVSDNLPFVTSLQRAFAGAPLAESLRHNRENELSVVCCSTAEEVKQVAQKSKVHLVLLDASLQSGRAEDFFVQLIRDEVFPGGVRWIVSSWEPISLPIEEAFVLYYPIQLPLFAQRIQSVLETPLSKWAMFQNKAIKQQRYREFHTATHTLAHQYQNSAGSREALLDKLHSLTITEQHTKLLKIAQPQWVEQYLSQFLAIRAQYPKFSQDITLQQSCERVKNALFRLKEFANDIPSETITAEQTNELVAKYKAAMDEAREAFKELEAFIGKEAQE